MTLLVVLVLVALALILAGVGLKRLSWDRAVRWLVILLAVVGGIILIVAIVPGLRF